MRSKMRSVSWEGNFYKDTIHFKLERSGIPDLFCFQLLFSGVAVGNHRRRRCGASAQPDGLEIKNYLATLTFGIVAI